MSSGCRFGCCTPEVAALPDGGWTTTDKGWKLDDRRREHVSREWREKSAQIDRMQADYPKCKLCGQAALRLDAAGLCSKTDESHRAYRVRLGLPAVAAAAPARGGRR